MSQQSEERYGFEASREDMEEAQDLRLAVCSLLSSTAMRKLDGGCV